MENEVNAEPGPTSEKTNISPIMDPRAVGSTSTSNKYSITQESERRSRPQMPYALDKSLLDIHGDLETVRQQMLRISALAKERSAIQRTASKLRFLMPWVEKVHPPSTSLESPINSPPGTPCNFDCFCQARDSFSATSTDIPVTSHLDKSAGFTCACENMQESKMVLTASGVIPNCGHYVAVSYCWEKPGTEIKQADSSTRSCAYQTLDILDKSIPGKEFTRPSRGPPHVIRRAARYAASKNCGLIWIDQECILQDDRNDKEEGIQSMDRVYANSKYPVGILKTTIQTQEELEAFGLLISDEINQYGRMVMQDIPWESIIHIVPGSEEQQTKMLDVLAITADRWFSRSWITQEVICSTDMVLLIEYDTKLLVPKNLRDQLIGEAQISITQLIKVTWWAMAPPMLARMSERPDQREILWEVFKKTWPFARQKPPEMLRNTCTLLSAWYLLQNAGNSRVADRLAIVGNLCDYPIRINSVEAEAKGLDFGTCIITQALLNGDMDVFLNRPMLTDFRGAISARSSFFSPCKGPWLSALVHYPFYRLRPFMEDC